ncbi:MAG: tRNA uridine-5-carboxymethylaminomethyl(34) synthesis GTPase MnmE, partial [Actinomycetia bacterium]|nr:tRNA uridine-5-carboxymethylaminomethyl(34) synthesis GTPase MnmE [Actinomycetes bacterium]
IPKHKVIAVMNKSDKRINEKTLSFMEKEFPITCKVSALKEKGIKRLESLIFNKVIKKEFELEEPFVLLNFRQLAETKGALEKASEALSLIKNTYPFEIISMVLREALNHLGKLTGEVTTEEILNEIFNNFCIGK